MTNKNDTFVVRNRKERCIHWIVREPTGHGWEHMNEEDLDQYADAPTAVRCTTCATYWENHWSKGEIAPTHMGSSSCKSGSIRSGGTNAHCTCKMCF